MRSLPPFVAAAILTGTLASAAPPPADAEVRLPYAEFRQLLDAINPPPLPETIPPALLGARLNLTMENGGLAMVATFQTLRFGEDPAVIPLIGGNFALESQAPDDAGVILRDGKLCHVAESAGRHTLRLRLLPAAGADSIVFQLPPCPSVMLETGGFEAGHSLAIRTAGGEEIIAAGQTRPLNPGEKTVTLRILDRDETQRALLPPEPSAWNWQHQALVVPAEGDLDYHVVARASASDGSGLSASLRMPPDARGIEASGDDLAHFRSQPAADRSHTLHLEWRTRGVLERDVTIRYRMPLRPLDPRWVLQAPSGGEAATRTRFIITESPALAYAGDGLRGPFQPVGLPAALAAHTNGARCHDIEAPERAEINVGIVPKATIADGVVTQAVWSLKLEPDGALLTEGLLEIAHQGPFGLDLDTPPGMKLLACEVDKKSVAPIDLGDGRLRIPLPPANTTSAIRCSFTGRGEAVDPVSGTLALALPMVPAFIRSLSWTIELPAGYQAETHGNLTRVALQERDAPSLIRLRKNLCREERPEVNVFYQREGL